MGNQHGKERRNYVRRIDWDNAEKPSPPGKPYLDPDCEDQDFITIRWSPPVTDGGAPILGYVVEHRRTGSPHWLRAIPYLAEDTQLTLTGLEPGWRYQFRVSAENDIGRSPPGDISDIMTVTSQRTVATSPHFNVELRDTVALENEKVEFTVHVVAIPQAKISWYKDGFEVFSSRRMKIVTENDQSTFIIHQAALEDEGEIKCTATNRAGHSVTKAILKLEALPRIRLPRQYEDGLLFEKGELIRLKVSTAGRPPPMVTWYHNGEPIQNGDKYEIQDAERSSSLKINEAQRDDRGEYQIRGVNKLGEDVVSFLVTVTDRPSHPGKPKVAMALGRSVTLSWASPDDDGGCKIGSYTVEYFRVGWNMWLKAATCRQLTTDLSDLIEGSEYKFRIKAENPYGMSDPSEESDIVFIPDPKRGILAPPQKTEATKTVTEVPWSSDVKKTTTEPTDEKLEKRRLLEENARKLLDTPLTVLLSQENTTTTRKVPPSPSPDLGKRTWEDVGTENVPPPVPKRRHRQRSTPSPNPPMEVDLPEAEQQKLSVDVDDGKKKKMGDEEEFPREKDHTMFHGSSELMLVLLPDEKSKSAELSAQLRSEIEMSLIGEGIAPPMSLSAPELGSDEPIELPPMRDAVSSTELLHERVMSRLYQDAMNEESQKVVRRRYSSDRRSVERRNSLREGNLLERRHSFKDTQLSEAKEVTSQPKSRIPVKTENMAIREEHIAVTETKKSLIPVLQKKSPERMSSVEREQFEFALVRERIRLKNEQNLQEQREREREKMAKYKSSGVRHQHSMSSASSQISSYGDEDEEEVEEEEEDYLEEEEEDLEESDEEVKPPSVPRHQTKKAPFAEEEDDTCLAVTSRIVLPRLEITLPPMEEVPEEIMPKELKTPAPEPEEMSYDEAPTKIPVKKGKAAKFLKKLGLKKKEKKVPEIIVEMDNSGTGSPLPRPILKNKPSAKKKDKGKKADEQMSTSCEEASDDGLSRKKKVRITEPSESKPTGPVQKVKPLTEDEQATQVLIYHYSDIVREFGHGKKPSPKVCLSCDEMKALAEADIRSSPFSESIPSLSSDMEERGSPIDLSEIDSVASSSTNVADGFVKSEDGGEAHVEVATMSPRVVPSDMKVRTSIDYLTDVAMFCFACWLYLFKNELYAIPVLFVMAYRQMSEAAREKYESMKASFGKRFSRKNRADDNG